MRIFIMVNIFLKPHYSPAIDILTFENQRFTVESSTLWSAPNRLRRVVVTTSITLPNQMTRNCCKIRRTIWHWWAVKSVVGRLAEMPRNARNAVFELKETYLSSHGRQSLSFFFRLLDISIFLPRVRLHQMQINQRSRNPTSDHSNSSHGNAGKKISMYML